MSKTTTEIATEYGHAKRACDIAAAYAGAPVFAKELRGILWASAPADATDSVIDAMLPHARDAFRERGLLLDETTVSGVAYVQSGREVTWDQVTTEDLRATILDPETGAVLARYKRRPDGRVERMQ
ncbi:MAG: hypothetical protein ACM3O6_13220 [Acidobacteriota bacterium]